ncbi:CBS domain-containing protein [Streptomyces sp. NBC_00154]|uniref:CBS domain-containing protein n=1 Tax=Streptomyces sp. NBC_00154 TaxID=2975670 RepID=UPI00225390A0|nr:CBS domain-containing protein [Streptomyces sp. NBC_00154]MCX5317524.1 CBS domain-containing protein [Streptomyces sp. NBC_00154]
MRHRRVFDLMTPTVVSVQRGTTFKEIARLLDEFDITAVPVVDEDERPVGVVSEADLLHSRSSRGGANTAVDLMNRPAITATPEWNVVRAARVMEKHKVKRLPVVDGEGRLIGVLSRSDLLQLFLRRDHAIQEEILEDVLTHTLRLSPSSLTVEVADGLVTLSGTVRRRSLVPVILRLCRSVDGVVDVINRLNYERDDIPVDARTDTQG